MRPDLGDAKLPHLSARGAVRLMVTGALSCERYCSALLERARRFRDLNAFSWLDDEFVLRQAREIDGSGGMESATDGVRGLPMAVKDNISTVGFPTSAGTSVLGTYRPVMDALIWARLKEQGSILFGKTNMHELAAGATSNNPTFGPVRHPSDRWRIAGGSSGGSAAAVAASIVPVALGTDTSGSVRVPAALCGIVGFRPATSGRFVGGCTNYPTEGVVPLVAALDAVGTMARCVDDVVLLHEAIAGGEVSSREAAGALRIGLGPQPFWNDLAPHVRQAACQAIEILRSGDTVAAEIDLSELAHAATSLQIELGRASRRGDLSEFLTRYSVGVDLTKLVDGIRSPDVKSLYEVQTSVVTRDVREISQALIAVQRELREACTGQGVDVLVYPTSPLTAPELKSGYDEPGDQVELNGRKVNLGAALARHARFASALGLPAVSLPIPPKIAGDLPIGLEIVGIDGSNKTALSAAVWLERILQASGSPGAAL